MIGLFRTYLDVILEILDVLTLALPTVPITLPTYRHLHPILKTRIVL